jgi:hypothetical protein
MVTKEGGIEPPGARIFGQWLQPRMAKMGILVSLVGGVLDPRSSGAKRPSPLQLLRACIGYRSEECALIPSAAYRRL